MTKSFRSVFHIAGNVLKKIPITIGETNLINIVAESKF